MIIAIGGATATGKSSLAVEIAKCYDGEIISADSMQIYRGMDIGTAKITEEEKGGIPHYMIDIVDPNESYSVAAYVREAEKIIKNIQERHKLPIIVGGTGLYIRSLLYNYSMGAYDEKLRSELYAEWEREGNEAMWLKLKEKDPIAANKIHPNNVKRVLRALEVVLLSGDSIAKVDKTAKKEHKLFCIDAERELLYERIDKRVDEMFEKGLADEVGRLLLSGIDFSMQSMQAIGYKEFKDYYSNGITLENVKEAIKLNSHHYAKRQRTWFRSMEAEWCKIEDNDKILNKIEQVIAK